APAPVQAPAQAAPAAKPAAAAAEAPVVNGAHEPVWVDSPECSACDECITLAPGVFAYDGRRRAVVINPKGASYSDIVKAAEKCTAGCLHPGTPWNPAEPNLEKLKQRAAKFN
ncbi:ferredoxin, partial [Rubrivivax gelatinosus]